MRKKKRSIKQKNIEFLLRVVLLALIFSIVISAIFSELSLIHDDNYERMYVNDVVFGNDFAMILLSSQCYRFSFYVSRSQGESIAIALNDQSTPRPMTHDIFVEALQRFWIKPRMIRITKIKDGIYYGELLIQHIVFRTITTLDIRPSDGIAIALRSDIPIYVNKMLVENVCIGKF